MKHIFTLLLSSFFSLSLLAGDGSRLSISSPGTSTELKIEVDGRKFSMKNNSITLSYLEAGRHFIKIYRDKKRDFRSGNQEDIIFQGPVFLHSGFHTDITVNRFGKVMTDECRIDHSNEWYNDEEDYYDNDQSGWNSGNVSVMTGREFETLKEQLRREWFETNRLTSVKVIIDKGNFTTQQVRELMLLFTFENNRLEVAKYAYCKTVDRQVYFQVSDALTFSSSKDELARFIRQSR